MPLALDPAQTTPLWLKSDEEKPMESRPLFICRFLTRKQQAEVFRLLEQADNENDYDRQHAILDRALAVGIIRWEKMPVDLKIEEREENGEKFKAGVNYDEYLTGREKFELANTQVQQTRLAEREKKTLPLPPQSAGADSAKDAAAGSV